MWKCIVCGYTTTKLIQPVNCLIVKDESGDTKVWCARCDSPVGEMKPIETDEEDGA